MADRVPRPHGEALGTADGGDGGRADGREGQSLVRNRATSSGTVDSGGMEESIWVSVRGQRHGIADRQIHRR